MARPRVCKGGDSRRTATRQVAPVSGDLSRCNPPLGILRVNSHPGVPMRILLAVALALAFGSRLTAADKPNVIVMMTDDQRHDFMSCAGHPFIKTPNMDRIAKDGYRYTNTFVTNSLCAPSRATLLTGQYSHVNGVRDNMGSKLNPDSPWLPDELRKLGYEVAFCGKSHVPGHFRDKTWDYYF